MRPVVPVDLPDTLPRSGNAFSRGFGRLLLRLGGWRLVGEVPPYPKLMVIVAPHSSFWDAFWGLAAKLAVGARIEFMVKKEAFRGPVGWILLRLGAIPTNRSYPGGIIGEMAQRFHDNERMWLGIAPEGTRKPVQRWKSGFWRIAREADVPVLCVYLDYPDRVVGLGAVFHTSADWEADMGRMRAFYAPFRGKHRGV